MKKSLFYRAKKMPPSAQIMLLFAVEGVFLQYITSINGFGLNLYATNMGATDSQIGIILKKFVIIITKSKTKDKRRLKQRVGKTEILLI